MITNYLCSMADGRVDKTKLVKLGIISKAKKTMSQSLEADKREIEKKRPLMRSKRNQGASVNESYTPSAPADTNFKELSPEEEMMKAREVAARKGSSLTEYEQRFIKQNMQKQVKELKEDDSRFKDNKFKNAILAAGERFVDNPPSEFDQGSIAEEIAKYEQETIGEQSQQGGEVLFKRGTKHLERNIKKEMERQKQAASTKQKQQSLNEGGYSPEDDIYIRKEELNKIISKTAKYAAKLAVKGVMSKMKVENDEFSFVYGGKLFKTQIQEIIDLDE